MASAILTSRLGRTRSRARIPAADSASAVADAATPPPTIATSVDWLAGEIGAMLAARGRVSVVSELIRYVGSAVDASSGAT